MAVRLLRGGSVRLLVGLACVSLAAPRTLEAQQPAVPRTAAERRALEHAERLRDGDRLAEARRVLEALLEAEPLSLPGLAALFEISDELADFAPFIPLVEWAARELGTESPALQKLWIRSLVAVRMPDSARSVARRWVRERPAELEAYAELAALESTEGRVGVAIAVLERGRSVTGARSTFSRELASLYAEIGDFDALAAEWLTILETESGGASTVAEAVHSLQRDPAAALARLWADLRASPDRHGRREGMILALRSGEATLARELADALIASASAPESRELLESFEAEATRAELPAEVAWAAGRLAERATERRERLRWRAVAAEMALLAADSSEARRAFEILLRDADAGSRAHRIASRRLFSLMAAEPASVSRSERLLLDHRRLYPDSAVALARMTTELSSGYVRAGRPVDARRVLDEATEVSAPAARALLEGQRGMLALYDGDPEAAAQHLREPAGAVELDPATRTRWIELLGVVVRADSMEARSLGETLLRVARYPGATSAPAELARWETIPPGEERSAMLAILARSFEAAGRSSDAATVRRHLIERFPDGPEAAVAMWRLARAVEPTDPIAASAWLERLITTYPESAMAPLARRLLADLRSRTGV